MGGILARQRAACLGECLFWGSQGGLAWEKCRKNHKKAQKRADLEVGLTRVSPDGGLETLAITPILLGFLRFRPGELRGCLRFLGDSDQIRGAVPFLSCFSDR
ncbi:hypothetical protein CAL21_20495 [Bordetella genomosp. 4]|nr:hypothetical protein CAL21_20495 [Bordetella genomosp. 4]